MTEAFRLAEAGRPRPAMASIMRGRPQRRPYSAQLKLGTSGTLPMPCGGVRMVRGMGWSNGQCSTLTTRWTRMGRPSRPASGGLARHQEGNAGIVHDVCRQVRTASAAGENGVAPFGEGAAALGVVGAVEALAHQRGDGLQFGGGRFAHGCQYRRFRRPQGQGRVGGDALQAGQESRSKSSSAKRSCSSPPACACSASRVRAV